MKPIIGITTYARNERNHFTLPVEYVECIRRAGGIPHLITPSNEYPKEELELLDALILSGGGDIHPSLYHGKEGKHIIDADIDRDKGELTLYKYILETGLPTLGICRGAEIINVAEGGDLYQDISKDVADSIVHRVGMDSTEHTVNVKRGSLLSKILGEESFSIASMHHQAIKTLAPGLEISALAEDGIIEAIEMPNHPWLIAVQWHPELTASVDPIQQRLFEAIVTIAKKNK